ncbi:MAG TPA: oligosaccharide flippase family protein [Candidatus Methylomirabilis sp.]|nr:oligosaccharide flippase family protein [Candidatus Methylomirabilis sp.]
MTAPGGSERAKMDVVRQGAVLPMVAIDPAPTDVQADIAVTVRNGLRLGASLLITWSVAMIVKLQVPAHLGPVRQGYFSAAESLAGVFFILIGLGIDTHIMREVSVRPRHASEIVGGIFVLRGLMSAALLIVMTAVLQTSRRPSELVVTAAVFGIANLIIANNTTLASVLQATSFAGPVAAANVAGKLAWAAGVLLALHYDAPLPLLALALPGGDLLKTAVLVPFARSRLQLQFRIDVPALRRALRASTPFFVNAMALGLLSNLGMSILAFIRTDPREVGWFAAVQNLVALCSLLMPLMGWVIMPLLSRAYARSEAEGLGMLRRGLEGLIILVAPLTVAVSASSDTLVRVAFGPAFAPAAPGLSILSLVFLMTYLDVMLAMALSIVGRGWSVTLVSIGSVFVNAALMLLCVPIGRGLIGTGGECAGAAASVVATEVFVLVAMLSRFRESPLDGRVIRALVKSVATAVVVLLVDRALRGLGPTRLVADAALYGAMTLALRTVRLAELRQAWRSLRMTGAG